MTRKEAMQAMLEKITAGEFFGDLPRPLEFHTDLCFKAFSGDLNAARSLHEALRPGEYWAVGVSYDGYFSFSLMGFDTFYAKDPAVAWLIALITGEIARCE